MPPQDPILVQLRLEDSGWQRFKKALKAKSGLFIAVRGLVGQDLHTDWDNHKLTLIRAFESADYQYLRCPLRKILKDLSTEQTKDLFHSLLKKSTFKDSASLSHCLNLITLEEIEKVLSASLTNELDRIQMNAEVYQESLLSNPAAAKNQAKHSFSSVINFLHCLLDTVLMAFRFFEMGKEPSSSWEASHFIQVYGQLLTFPVILLTAINGLVASTGTAILITAAIIFVILASLFAYVKWLKPCPSHIEPFENLTQAALDGKIKPVSCRDKEIDDIVQCLTGSEESRSHPFLQGLSGVGKTEIIKGLAWKIAHNQIPKLKGKKVFSVNSALLVNSFNQENKLLNAIKRIGKHGKDVILFLDEAQIAFYQANKASLGDHLLTVLGTGPGSLPYCIFATTPKGYDDYLSQEDAFIRRTYKIPVKPTDKPDTLRILREMLMREAPEMELSASLDSLLETIFEKSSELQGAQPALSKRVLDQALSTLKTQALSDPPELQAKKKEAEELYSKYKLQFHTTDGKAILGQYNQVKAAILPMEGAQKKVQAKYEERHHLEKQKSEQRERLLSLSSAISQERNGAILEKLQKEYLFALHCLIPAIEKDLQSLKSELEGQSKVNFDVELIERLVKELSSKQDPS
jgi:ATP-dependent Clp protease ATP-binding subunit ClpA